MLKDSNFGIKTQKFAIIMPALSSNKTHCIEKL